MNSSELKACRDALGALTSQKHSGKNYLFIAPVDPAYVPGYDKIITHPMDLGTVGIKLESGQYDSSDEFWADIDLVFSNALKFNSGRKELAHVVKLTKEMMKLVDKEKQKHFGPQAAKKSTGLKLKLSAPSAKPSKETAIPKPKLSINLKPPSVAATAAAADKSKVVKPKLKLSLSMNKAKSSDPSPTNAAPTPKTPVKKIRISAPNRGKELPEGVSKPAQSPSVASAKSSSSTKSTKSNKKQTLGTGAKSKGEAKTSKRPSPPPSAAPNAMTLKRTEQCIKILYGLRRREYKIAVWFLQPVSDKAIIDDYRAKIPKPMDLGTMMNKLERNQYPTTADFVLDLRRVFANCLRYNTSRQDQLRPLAIQMLTTAEELMAYFLARPDAPTPMYPSLLYCWELCVNLIDRLLNVTNPDGLQTAHFFLHPASYFFGGSFPAEYISKIPKPMDFGTVTTNLIEGNYQTIAAFSADCRLVLDNCLTYYGGREDGKEFVRQATHLKALMSQQLDALTRYDQSASGGQARALAVSWQNVRIVRPPDRLLLSILNELRSLTYTDRLTKLSQPAMRPFEKPLDLNVYRDYLNFVQTPMDLETIERKVKSGVYETADDFEYDVNLIFRNCEAYNAPRKTEQMVSIGKFGAKEFRKLFARRMRSFENPEEEVANKIKRAASPSLHGGKSAKRFKADTDDSSSQPRASTPRISITAQAAAAAEAAAKAAKLKAKSPVNMEKKKENEVAPGQPVPLHVAIAEVKARYPLRRQIKFLEPWEAACAKFFKEFMKHPWINVARPKFIFHCPVASIFPELKDSYLQKIRKPMDLTTVEAKLFQGGLYYEAQDFIDDLALVFSNAITFNKDGRDVGDHVSIAYYDASIHLLKYTRWFSLESLQEYLSDDPHVDEPMPDGVPPSNWKLSIANRNKSREEIYEIVMNEQIDKGIEGDRFPATWMEGEMEKLLKALRHQSDSRKMSFFIEPRWPPDYTAYIARPMAWQTVSENLRKRKYIKFGEVVEDLRLIFSNALKYNARHKELDPISRMAYDGALDMSAKLESAIERMNLTMSDRLGREKVEHGMDERAVEAAERAEEERIQQAIARGEVAIGDEGGTGGDSKVETVETVRVIQRIRARRDLDMDQPFFDEDDASRGQSHVEAIRQQRATYERQQRERAELHQVYLSIRALVYGRHLQAKQFNRSSETSETDTTKGAQYASADDQPMLLGSSVAADLNKVDRLQIKLQPIKAIKKRKRQMIPPPLSLE